MKVVVVIEMVMLEEVDREITKKEADNVAGNISNLYLKVNKSGICELSSQF